MDCWLQESYKPNKPAARKAGLATDEDHSSGPDLFSFPANGSGWQPDQIFGALHGTGVMSPPVAALKRDPLEEMSSALNRDHRLSEVQAPGLNQPPPPTPHRISSLHAQTGSADRTVLTSRRADRASRRNSRRGSLHADKNRTYSLNNATQTSPPKMRSMRQVSEGADPGKRTYYPPIAGQSTRGRINAFFKRAGSLSLAPGALASVAQQPHPPPSPAADKAAPSPRDGRSSVPPPSPRPWPINRHVSDTMQEDLHSATPPPIMRSRAPSQVLRHEDETSTPPPPPDRQTTDGAQDLPIAHTVQEVYDVGGPYPLLDSGGGALVNGGKRRWLGMGRKGSLRNRVAS